MLFATLGGNLFRNILAGTGVIPAGEEIFTEGQDF